MNSTLLGILSHVFCNRLTLCSTGLQTGIGVDDMFLLMSSWSETISERVMSVPDRLGATFASAGIGITVTSLTDFVSFIIGTSSAFRSVTNFSIYTGEKRV